MLIVLEGEPEISERLCGEVTVYFRRENKPVGTLFNTGSGFTLKAKPKTGKSETDDSSAAGTSGHKSPTQDKLDLRLLEDCGRSGMKLKEVSAVFAIKTDILSFYLYSKKYPQFGAAYRRGKDDRQNPPAKLSLERAEIDALLSFLP